jgi:hypothetical protein
MRLNRVLLLAATISMMMFALVFTISCSGDDGKNGKNGKGCSAEANGKGGYDVTCDGEYMGNLEGTADHVGKTGADGPNGKNGSFCVLGNQTDTNIEIRCNGEVAGTLDACTVKALSDPELQITCKNTEIHVCRLSDPESKVFDATKFECVPNSDGFGDIQLITASSTIQCQADKKSFSKATYYCGYANEKATKRTALPKCSYKLDFQPNQGIDVSRTVKYNTMLKCTNAGGDLITHIASGERTVDEQYGYTQETGAGTLGINKNRIVYDACFLNLRPRYGEDEKTGIQINNTDDCLHVGGDTLRLVDDNLSMYIEKWGSRTDTDYYFDLETNYDTDGDLIWKDIVITNDNIPDSKYICVSPWQNQYCRYTSNRIDPTHHPITSAELCGGARINEGKWQGQYCGYLEKVNNKGFLKSVQTGLCDDYYDDDDPDAYRKGPNEDYFNAGYCTVLPANRIEGKTTYVNEYETAMGFSSDIGNFCGSGSKNKPNNGKWNKEYCGFVWKNVTRDGVSVSESSPNREKVYSDICDDLSGPMEYSDTRYAYCEVKFENRFSGFTTRNNTPCGASGQPNKNTWSKQYCGYKKENSEGQDKVYTGICDDGYGPSQNSYNKGEYCQALKDSTTFLSDYTCELGADGKINVDTWKGEYCGYASEDAAGTSKLTGACGDADGKGPHSDIFGGGYCQAVDKEGTLEYTSAFCGEDNATVNEGGWKGEYCGFGSETSMRPDKVYTGACDDFSGPNASGLNSGYCRWVSQESTETEFSSELCGGATMNEGSWKGEYCYSDDKVAVCTGGRIPNTDKKSTDPFSVRCTFTSDELICTESNLAFCDKDGCDDLGEGYKWDTANNECLIDSEATE